MLNCIENALTRINFTLTRQPCKLHRDGKQYFSRKLIKYQMTGMANKECHPAGTVRTLLYKALNEAVPIWTLL